MTRGMMLAVLVVSGLAVAHGQSLSDRVTVAGCLQRAQLNGSVGGTAVGTSSSPSTADDDANSGVMLDRFLLAQARPVVAGVVPAEPSGTSASAVGTSGSATREEPTSYALSGREPELERHQGARLQVTGSLMPPASSGRGTGGSATASGVKRLKVESFKVLAETCR